MRPAPQPLDIPASAPSVPRLCPWAAHSPVSSWGTPFSLSFLHPLSQLPLSTPSVPAQAHASGLQNCFSLGAEPKPRSKCPTRPTKPSQVSPIPPHPGTDGMRAVQVSSWRPESSSGHAALSARTGMSALWTKLWVGCSGSLPGAHADLPQAALGPLPVSGPWEAMLYRAWPRL